MICSQPPSAAVTNTETRAQRTNEENILHYAEVQFMGHSSDNASIIWCVGRLALELLQKATQMKLPSQTISPWHSMNAAMKSTLGIPQHIMGSQQGSWLRRQFTREYHNRPRTENLFCHFATLGAQAESLGPG